MNVVLDTIVLLRGLIKPYGQSGRILFDHFGDYGLVVSPTIVTEYLEVLRRPELVRKYQSVANRDLQAILRLIERATVVVPTSVPAVSRDPTDDKFLAAAKVGNADVIVTADNDLLDLGAYEQIAIVTAEAFLLSLEL
ncbi:MAG: putative toxin-antitoxin system toxin component, PIN family [Gemmatimonadales bacterium]|nr:putative toxin-antitoxin system toxin component, PIN family [Gemmatimonadales bacterium]MDQ3411437.1 putative toxin-antitoxin system toxin component, PIN family [Chloroflexota bacterium]